MLPAVSAAELCAAVRSPALMITGWYDWCLDDALRTWELLAAHGRAEVRAASRLLITPSAHQAPGYHEGRETHPELDRTYRDDPALLLYWHDAVRTGSVAALPVVTYYLMGANQWCTAGEWPPAQARRRELYFGPAGTLCWDTPPDWWEPDRYTYDPQDPTPTVGGSILSAVYPPGSVDVTELQLRTDVLTFTTGAPGAGPRHRRAAVTGPVRELDRGRHRLRRPAVGRVPRRPGRPAPERRRARALPRR